MRPKARATALASSVIPLLGGLATFLTGLVFCLFAFILICAGPIASIMGYNALFNRLWRENPRHPVWRTSGAFEMSATQRQIVWAYIAAYGVDVNVVLTIGGLVMALPGLYLGGRLALFVLGSIPDIHL